MSARTGSRRMGVLRRMHSDEDGVALVVVVGSMLVLAMFMMVGLTYAISSTRFSRLDQDYTAAMTAAQSGIEDYISRLNRYDNYGRSPDCTDTSAMTNPTDCGGAPYAWLPVTPGETDPTAPQFHYDVDTTLGYTEGTIMVTSTGRANDVYRTIEVAIGKGGSTDFVYYTDFEDADPDNIVAYSSGAPSRVCGRDGAALASYFFPLPGFPARSGCSEIQFGVNDVLDGRVHSNDAILSVGGRFRQGVESSYPRCRDRRCEQPQHLEPLPARRQHLHRDGRQCDLRRRAGLLRAPPAAGQLGGVCRLPRLPLLRGDPDHLPVERHDDRVEQELELRRCRDVCRTRRWHGPELRFG